MLQIRPAGDSSAKPYAPQRDLLHLFFPMGMVVGQLLESPDFGSSELLQKASKEIGVTPDELGDALGKYAACVRLFTRHKAIKTIEDAMQKSGFSDLPPKVQVFLFGLFGVVMTSGVFHLMRTGTPKGQPASYEDDMAAFYAKAREFLGLNKDAKVKVLDEEYLIEKLNEAHLFNKQAQEEILQLRHKVAELQKQLDDNDEKPAAPKAPWWKIGAW